MFPTFFSFVRGGMWEEVVAFWVKSCYIIKHITNQNHVKI